MPAILFVLTIPGLPEWLATIGAATVTCVVSENETVQVVCKAGEHTIKFVGDKAVDFAQWVF